MLTDKGFDALMARKYWLGKAAEFEAKAHALAPRGLDDDSAAANTAIRRANFAFRKALSAEIET
jgi:hypothetical protein